MTVKEITKEWLKNNGYGGLSGVHCCCELADLMPCLNLSLGCGVDQGNCEAGYKIPCPGPELCEAYGDCPFHISLQKPNDRKSEVKDE